ncbi:FAR-17a/AIG1-like protein [Penicillium atrosanguineum]|uniref:FAR-17a/AIG1-like protein n=1 Tax=Penicillium atrosanguineum TaxID=1132637 RepID=A0A9W9GZQ0_9EURO|nr:Ribosome biogenesis protein BRX1 [Penicillium atrosanguineum]KAJ5133032.1 FAR-17a/AIG1-like protein [Penicillium atrosanguineum]KAJ5290701.1 Ribosome biogenesis protein BRX1 [Penicillium atrosanguineum]KAJ5308523.1 FAR-17a/AIG1-like protein [Penicillium atrosanguineum]
MAQKLTLQHPLQRLPSPSRGFSALVHATGLASFLWSFKWMHDNPNQANEAYGWHFQYLTVIGLGLSTLTFACGLLADLTLSRRLFLAKNILSVCSCPMEVLISVLYWGLHLIDKNLVVPPEIFIPIHADISFHAIPSIVMLVDLLLLSPPWTITALPSLGLSGAIAFGYWFWVEKCFSYNGWYPYPIFELLPTPGRIGLFSMSAIVMALSTATLKCVYGRINGFGTLVPAQSRSGDIKKEDGL